MAVFSSIGASSSTGGFTDLFITGLMPVLKMLLVTAVGSFLAIERVGILGEDARKHLNNMVFFVFNPALVASNLAKSITLKSMAMLWFMPLNILITFIIGSALGLLLIRITRTPRELRGLVLGCCSAGNLGNLPLIIIPAVCREKGSPFGDVNICYTHGLAYASLSMAIGAIYLWSYVYNIVRIYSNKSTGGAKLNDSAINMKTLEETPKDLSKCGSGPLLPLKDIPPTEDRVDCFEISSTTSAENPSKDCPLIKDRVECFEIQSTTSAEKAQVSNSQKMKEHLKKFAMNINLKILFAPSTTGAIVGFIIGLVPPFREALIGDGAPLRVVEDSSSLLGDAAIPTVTLIVGANLLKGLKGSGMKLQLIVGIAAVRYIALPILGIIIIKGAVRYGLVQSDPLYQFVLLLQFALPPAMNIATIIQLFGAGESECSVIMLSTYALASVSLTLWSTFFMWLVA